MAPTNYQVHSVVEGKEYKPGKFLHTYTAQETEGFRNPGIRLTKKRKPRSESSPLRFRSGEPQNRSKISEHQLVSSRTVGNWINTDLSI